MCSVGKPGACWSLGVLGRGQASLNYIYSLGDVVKYGPTGSYFNVWKGQRTLAIGDSAFERTFAGQLGEAAHEIVHAQQFARMTARRFGGNMSAAEKYFFGPQFAFGSPMYACGERVAETVARLRINDYLGGMSLQQWGASTRYINGF